MKQIAKIKPIRFVLMILMINLLSATENIKVASSVADTSYHNVVKSMATIFNENKSEYTFIPIETQGSVDNIKRLINHEADFAIVQNDIAFFAENGLSLFTSKEENLRIVIPLFVEPIFLLTKIPNVHNLAQIKNKKIAIGEKNSGLSESAKVLLNSVGIWGSGVKYNFSENEALEKLKNGNV